MAQKEKRTGIKDIAQETGFSIATVSRVLNATNMYYSEETRKTIEDTAKRLHYLPNLVAKGLKQSRTYNIAYLVPQIDDFYSGIYNSMQLEASAKGYSIVIFSSNYSEQQERLNISHILEKQYDGIVVVTGLLDSQANQNISETFPGIPVVLVEGIEACENIRRVCVDVKKVCCEAVEYLINLGHTRIAYVSAPQRFQTLKYRYFGYQEGFAKKNLACDESLVFFEAGLELSRFDECYQVMRRIIVENDFSAMLVMSDWAAFAAIRAAHEIGRRIPEDLSIIGFDNLPFTDFSQPTLTTISQKSDEIGRHSIELLLNILEDKPVEDVYLQAQLVLRQSVAACTR